MQITLMPMRHDLALEVSRQGDVLVLNGQALDFGAVTPETPGLAESFACPWLVSDVQRQSDGRLCLSLILPHGPEAPPETLYPAMLELTGDGLVDLPPFGPGADQAG